jgi:hypothetical protein
MKRRSRATLTPLGAILLGLLAAGLVAGFVGSHTVQVAGFVVVVTAVLLLLADRIPARMKWWLTPPTLRKASGLTKPEPWTSRRERELLELRARRRSAPRPGPRAPTSPEARPKRRTPGRGA